MIREILKYPNKILKNKCENVLVFDDNLHNLLDDMYETMISAEGIGLAAIQIGVLQNILIINMPDDTENQIKENLIEAINPQILEQDILSYNTEGCLSVPDFNAKVKRFQNIKVQFQDRFGTTHTKDYENYDAVAWQHEMDHLNGILFVDRLSILDKRKFLKKIKQNKSIA